MLCRIADLLVTVPEKGNLPERCRPYEIKGLPGAAADIVIAKSQLNPKHYPQLSPEDNYYLDSGFSFYRSLLRYDGLMLHASCVAVDGLAYLFSGPCGVGKSTHSAKYLKAFEGAFIINDDKPALRYTGGCWRAYGTPWCGRDGINRNTAAPVAGICFLKQGDTELIRLSPPQAAAHILSQTTGRASRAGAELLLRHIDRLIGEIPVYLFTNHAEENAEQLTYTLMRRSAMNYETKS